MTYSDIKQQISSQTLDRFFIFSGNELEVLHIYINKIADVNNQTIRTIDSISEITKIKSGGLVNQSFCFVCYGDDIFQKDEKAWDKVSALLKQNTLIYVPTSVDKRSKFYNHFSDKIVMFDYMQRPVLIKHIKEHINLSTDNCNVLADVCENSFSRILLEIDKIKCYCDAMGSEANADIIFQQLLNDGTIYQPPTDAIFDWVDSVLEGKPRKAFKLYQDCIDMGEPPLKLITVLYQGIKRLLQVQSCTTKNISDNTGLSLWEINLVTPHIGIYGTSELVNALKDLRKLEVSIKTGKVEDSFAVPYALIFILLGE